MISKWNGIKRIIDIWFLGIRIITIFIHQNPIFAICRHWYLIYIWMYSHICKWNNNNFKYKIRHAKCSKRIESIYNQHAQKKAIILMESNKNMTTVKTVDWLISAYFICNASIQLPIWLLLLFLSLYSPHSAAAISKIIKKIIPNETRSRFSQY
jgi:hypothetical protein